MAIEVEEERETVFALLRWVYCEAVEESALLQDVDAKPNDSIGARAVRLGHRWGLRDVGSMQSRVAARRLVKKAQGTLAEDVLRAYDVGRLSDGLRFRPLADNSAEPGELLDGGWEQLLKVRSSYFRAMLDGPWLESSHGVGDQVVIEVRWTRNQLERVLRFIHGAPFVESAEDVPLALECAKYFGMPSLLAEICSWIVADVTVATASGLWRSLGEEIATAFCDDDACEHISEADDAFFEYHIQNFEVLATPLEPASEVPLHDLSIALMRRLLTGGQLDVSTWKLKAIVKGFVLARCCKDAAIADEVYESLRPPAVLFNRTNRSCLCGLVNEVSARDFV